MFDVNEDIREDNKRNLVLEFNGFYKYRSERCQIVFKVFFGFYIFKIKFLRKSFIFRELRNFRLEVNILEGNIYCKRFISQRDVFQGFRELFLNVIMCGRGG